jgi:hypothetical protein
MFATVCKRVCKIQRQLRNLLHKWWVFCVSKIKMMSVLNIYVVASSGIRFQSGSGYIWFHWDKVVMSNRSHRSHDNISNDWLWSYRYHMSHSSGSVFRVHNMHTQIKKNHDRQLSQAPCRCKLQSQSHWRYSVTEAAPSCINDQFFGCTRIVAMIFEGSAGFKSNASWEIRYTGCLNNNDECFEIRDSDIQSGTGLLMSNLSRAW